MSVFANWMMDQEEEDELDPALSDIIGEKKRRKKEKGVADVENDMLFNIDVWTNKRRGSSYTGNSITTRKSDVLWWWLLIVNR